MRSGRTNLCPVAGRSGRDRRRPRRTLPSRGVRSEDGTAALEFALILPLLLVLLLGIVTVGLTYSNGLGLKNAVREGSRFGATADASPALASAWADNVISQIRQTQFDDPTAQSQVCVELWQVGSGPVANTAKCSSTGGSWIALPADATSNPAVPANATGTCVVRVLAARPFTISIGVASWNQVQIVGAIEHYERKDKVPSCG